MKRLLVFICIVLMTLLQGCSSTSKGYVYDKQQFPGYTQTFPGRYTEDCITVNYEEECETIYTPGFTIYNPPHWDLYITSCQTLQTDGQCQTNDLQVSESDYSNYQIGSYYQGEE